jgi:uncharacterized protein YjbI with pentapeptide repeats
MADKVDPFDVEALESAVNDSATRVSAIWISFLIFSLYLLITATTVTQRQLLLAEPVKLPVLNIDLPLWGFFFLAPTLFVILHAYVLLQVVLLGRTAAAYNAAVARAELSPEENNSLRQRLANTLFAQIFAGAPREREGWLGRLLIAMAWITLAIAPILILLAFQFSFLAYHSHIATWTHRLLILVELVALFLIWPLVLDAQADFQWPKVSTDLKQLAALTWRLFGPKEQRRNEWQRLREQAAALAICLLFIIVSLSIATFPGEPHVNLFTLRPLTSVQCDRWVHQKFGRIDLQFDRLNLPNVDLIDEGKLAEIEKHTSERDLPPSQGERTQNFRDRDLNCSDLSHADLRRVDLTNARLDGAFLFDTVFEGAILNFAQLQGAILAGAHLEGASLDFAQLQGANLWLAQLQGASLGDTQLQGASLNSAQLQGANFTRNIGFISVGAHLQGASLDAAQLQGAYFIDVQLQGASLVSANLQGAFFENAHLQGANFSNAILDHTVLSRVSIWRAANAACLNARVTNRNSDSVLGGNLFARDTATPDAIGKFVEDSVADMPDTNSGLFLHDKEQVVAQMRAGLGLGPVKDDTEAIAKVWSDCEVATSLIPQEKFDEEHVALLRNLVCDASRNRASIAQGIVDIWISDSDKRRAFSVRLARGLLGQDGKGCAAMEDFYEPTKKKLRTAAAMFVSTAPSK